MNINNLRKKVAALAIGGVVLPAAVVWSQSVPASSPVQPVAPSAPTIQLSSGAQQVLQLVQAKISDDTILAFVQNSRINYDLNANDIVYLRQQGVSSPVLTAMLNQSGKGAVPPPAAPATVPMATTPAPPVSADNAPVYAAPPATTTVESAPATVYYDDPYDYPYYYYDPYYYGYYPPVGLYFGGGGGWGRGWHGGRGDGGGHGGGGFHGGGGGGFHGGGGGHR